MARKKAATAANGDWQLPNNHQNILFMLANGLITGPKGFDYEGESRYFKDVLSLYQGWIPLYRNSIPAHVRSMAQEESDGLIPVIAKIDLKDYGGEAYVYIGGEWELKAYADIKDENQLIALPAPLPAAWISNLSFENKKDLNSFQSAADDVGNVELPGLQLSSPGAAAEDERLSLIGQGSLDRDAVKPFPAIGEPEAQTSLMVRAQALGGLVAMLYHLADNSDLGVEIFKKTREALLPADSGRADGRLGTEDVIMKGIPHWIAGKEIPGADWRTSFFFGLLEHIIKSRRSPGSRGVTSAAREYVSAQLKSAEGRPNWSKVGALMEELASPTLRPSELFEKFPGPISHALILFFQGERCEYLLEFQAKNPRVVLSDADIVAAALLFGAREGWSGLARQYRRGLSQWVTSLMASKVHYKAAIGFNVPDLKPVREFFAGEAWDLNEARALEVARKNKWKDCLLTRVKVPNSFSVEEGYITLAGDAAVKVIVKKDVFLNKLREASFDEKEISRKVLGVAG